MKLKEPQISEIAKRVYYHHFTEDVIDEISGDDFIDWTGEEAIRVNIMIKPGMVGHLKGDKLSEASLELQDELTAAGEERFAHPSFGEIGEVFEGEDELEKIEEPDFKEEDVGPRP